MTCEPCRDAGKYITWSKNQTDPEKQHHAALMAESFHEDCQHPDTCSCQHHVTLEAIQKEFDNH